MAGGFFGSQYPHPVNSVYHCPAFDRLPGLYDVNAGSWGAYGYNVSGVAAVASTDYATTYSGLGLAGHAVPFDYNHVWFDGPGPPPVRESEVLQPANMIAMADGRLLKVLALPWPTPTFRADFWFLLAPIQSGKTSATDIEVGLGDGVYQRRHNTRFNVLFCDGHVETLKIGDLFTTRSDFVLSRWNNDTQPHRELAHSDF